MRSYEHVGSEVKLSAIIEERLCDILLYDDRPIFILSAALGHSFLDIIKFISALDPISTVAELTRL